MSAPFAYEQEVAIAAVRRAAQLCQAVQAEIQPDVLAKKDRSPVTVADFGSQALVCRALRTAFPEDPIIAEEDAASLRSDDHAGLRQQVVQHVQTITPEADEDAILSWIDYGGAQDYHPRFWTLDPIDGTKGFLRGEQYAVALALVVDGEVVAAAMACPNLPAEPGSDAKGVVFAARKDAGTIRLPLSDGEGVPVETSDLTDSAQAAFCESVEAAHSSHGDAARVAEILGITKEAVRLDSQAKYGVVARGEADIYLRLPTRPGYVEKIWDHAAGMLVVQEAGGIVTDLAGQPLDFSHGYQLAANRGVIVTNGPLHEAVLAALAEAGVR